jgi:transcriptional regulator with XRE-family HTH domain
LENQENILDLYYNKHLKQKDIATMVGVSKQYVSKVVKTDSRFKEEKQTRKDENAIKRKDYMKQYYKDYERPKKEDNSYEQLQALLYQDSLELSYSSSNMNDYAFAKYNSSIYHRDKNGNLRLNKGIKVGSDVPNSFP